ncbi:TRAFAC clade GTPase domain-containing protein [Calidifontibacter indicus]|uniref:Double-GTPase 2 domain-containing protein n=1 Tax=Calidifontibacter indicus TaxID=419650 RepID=A0A3D9USR3_9MICO|nr:ATP/GTP-binding protein [Calidifontibacter indicus]REF29685.1 hypothetical protein DFJ65_0649 [Calidifontibacter indicus]
MAKYPRVREQHVAVFGESGSGKTVLVSSFYGPTQQGSYKNDLWDLVADDTGQGSRLNRNFVGMRDHATAPPPTRTDSTTYYFSVKLKGDTATASKDRTFDTLRLAWHDCPGEWFEETPSSAAEESRRVDTFRSLMRSDVAMFLVDGRKLLEHRGEEERYLSTLFTNFRQGLLRIKGDLQADDERIVEFPRIWIIALSKADLLPELDVHAFRDMITWKALGDVERLRSTIAELVDTPEALSVGDDFLLLSSAKFELAPDRDNAPESIDVTRQMGVDLVLPIATALPLERRVQWTARMNIPRKVLDSLADGAETIAAGLVAGGFLTKVVAKVPRVGRLSTAASPALVAAARLAGDALKDANEQARANRDVLAATLTQFKLDLERGVEERLLLTSRK